MRRAQTLAIGALGAQYLSLGLAHGGVDVLSARRDVRLDFGTPSAPPVFESSKSLGLFDESVSDFVFDDVFGAFASASSSQTSTIGPGSISATGMVSANASTDGFVLASTVLTALIEVTETTAYSASADLFDLNLGNPDFSFFAALTDGAGDGNEIWSMSSGAVPIPGVGSFSFDDQEGTLEAGLYFLEIRVSAGGFKDATTAGGFGFDFVLPAPGSAALLGMAGLIGTRRRRG